MTDRAGATLHWPAIVGFSSVPIPYDGLLGNFGCLVYMNATFRGEDNEFTLQPNGSYPGVEIPAP